MANRLAQETSPYLLQHKDNPVDWYPWSPEALERAKTEDKPILLSIGYSACHWCHVMAHESFEGPEIAKLMNENFINIKVDREERPDLDQIYQNVAQAMTQSGGWPLTVFLTPELKPFYGGTYFPPEDRFGRPGFPRVLNALADAFRKDRDGILEQAEKLTEYIGNAEKIPDLEGRDPAVDGFKGAAEKLLSYVDWNHGGLGSAPKFPNAMAFGFLWRFGVLSGSAEAKRAVLLSLKRMASGGIYDQLGGGFHRYSVDNSWSVPHFEKMLYDNGLLLKLYSEVLVSRDSACEEKDRALFTRIVAETVGYVLREMVAPEGCFFSAQDADSEGEEGKFFVWDPEELATLLGPAEAEAFSKAYGVEPEGNFEHGKTVLYLAQEPQSPEEIDLVRSARKKLLQARAARIRPETDVKILVSWNSLMISGLAWASLALRESAPKLADDSLSAAIRCYEVIRGFLGAEGRLPSTIQGGKAKGNAYLDDYAFFSIAALDLARARPEQDPTTQNDLNTALQSVKNVLEHFKDPEGPGYFFVSDEHEKLIHRPKTLFDQAIPSGTAMILTALSALEELGLTEPAWDQERHSQIRKLFPLAVRSPYGSGELLSSALLHFRGPFVVCGGGSRELVRNAFVFRKPAPDDLPEGSFLICHRKSCGLPGRDFQAGWSGILSKLTL